MKKLIKEVYRGKRKQRRERLFWDGKLWILEEQFLNTHNKKWVTWNEKTFDAIARGLICDARI